MGQWEGFSGGGGGKCGWEHIQIVPKHRLTRGSTRLETPSLCRVPMRSRLRLQPCLGEGGVRMQCSRRGGDRPAALVAQPPRPSLSLAVFQVTPIPEPEIS